MAEISAFHIGEIAAQFDNPNIPHTQFNAAVPTIDQGYAVGAGHGAEKIDGQPVALATREIDAFVVPTFERDWYHRIHLVPRQIRLGNVVSSQVREVLLWNAHLTPQTLAAITAAGDEALALTAPAPPHEFRPLEYHILELAVDTDGPPTIDARYEFAFPAETPALHVTGVRVQAWPFVPDWTTPLRETLAWSTDPLRSPSGVTQRRALRLSPRRSWTAQFVIDGRERTYFDLLVHAWGGRVWALPIFPDAQRLAEDVDAGATTIPCATAGRDFVPGGFALLRAENAFTIEVVEIEAIDGESISLARPTQSAWPARSRLYPARAARLIAQPADARITDTAIRSIAEFVVVEPSDWDPLDLPSYRGFHVYDDRPEESEDLSRTYERLMRTLDTIVGIPHVVDTADLGFGVQMHRWVLDSIETRAAWRGLVYRLRGAQVPVWVPTHADDVRLAAPLGAGETSMTVEHIGYHRFGLTTPGRRNLRIELLDGSVFYRQIAAASPIDDDTEALVIDSALGVEVAPDDALRISFMALSVGEDLVEIEHLTDIDGGAAISRMLFTAVRDDDV